MEPTQVNQLRSKVMKDLLRQSGWKHIQAIIDGQKHTAISNFKKAGQLHEFFAAQAELKQAEGFEDRVKNQINMGLKKE